jgi:spermidine synthase
MRLFAVTIFISAFLLFQVQPLIGKYILPWFGGGPGVWTTCLLFFQTVLLGGYAYAHFVSTRLSPRIQGSLHLALLVVSLAWFPIIPDASWKPEPGAEPVSRILLLLGANLGLPYLILSATGPLLQRWFSLAHPGIPPYRLYSLSNAGSLLALLGYPFVIEPLLTRSSQALAWSAGLVVFVVLCGGCAWRIRGLGASTSHVPDCDPPTGEPRTTRLDQFMWLALPALASILLLATTNKLCLDVAVVPFLWVVPLSLYLLSFILCFDHPRWYSRRLFSALFALGCGVVCYFLTQRSLRLPLQVAGYSLTLFAACMTCHGELHRLRPTAQHLTRYYLFIAAGGALGSLLVAVVAPLVLSDYYELQIGLALLVYFIGVMSLLYRSRGLACGTAAGVLAAIVVVPVLKASGPDFTRWFFSGGDQLHTFYARYWKEISFGFALLVVCLRNGWRIGTGEWRRGMSAFPLVMSFLLGSIFTVQIVDDRRNLVESVRNFYGTLKLRQYNESDPASHFYLLSHGETTHGMQFLNAPRNNVPTSYYGATSGVGRAIDLKPGARRIGVVGLGSGTLAAYGRLGDTLRFYDINPAVIPIAEERFSYLRHTLAKVDIVLGDARLTLEDELRRGMVQSFDLLALDAFSSDAIPVHLLTREAMAVYLKHLKPDGVLAVHVSNRYLNLKPVVEGLARHYGLFSVTVSDDPPEEEWWFYGSDWILLTKNQALLETKEIMNSAEVREDHAKAVEWTDDYASLLGILK